MTLKVKVNRPPPPPPPPKKKKKKKNNRDINQVVLHLWSKSGDHSLNSLVQNQTLVTIWRRLPKLAANISSEFHHLVNTELAVGSLVKWLPIKVAHPCKSDLKQFICSCLASYFFSGKATTVGSPANFPKLISQLWKIPQPPYFISLLLHPH